MSKFNALINYFERFPGVGTRQAHRLAFHVLKLSNTDAKEIAKLIVDLKQAMSNCASCHRFFTQSNREDVCGICGDKNRDRTKLMILEQDIDIKAVEKAGTYDGLYFVLGGTVPLLNKKSTNPSLRGEELKQLVEKRGGGGDLKEIILAFSINPDGDNTTRFVESLLQDIVKINKINLSHLGRGLSTGSELEYADSETIKHALKTRLSRSDN